MICQSGKQAAGPGIRRASILPPRASNGRGLALNNLALITLHSGEKFLIHIIAALAGASRIWQDRTRIHLIYK